MHLTVEIDSADRVLARESVDAGHPYALVELARMRVEACDRDGAEGVARQAVDAGYPEALFTLGRLREEAADRLPRGVDGAGGAGVDG